MLILETNNEKTSYCAFGNVVVDHCTLYGLQRGHLGHAFAQCPWRGAMDSLVDVWRFGVVCCLCCCFDCFVETIPQSKIQLNALQFDGRKGHFARVRSTIKGRGIAIFTCIVGLTLDKMVFRFV